MGLWGKLFGEKKQAVVAKPLTGEELVARVRAGDKVNLRTALAGADDDAEEAALWTLLPFADGPLRVEVVERLAGFELDPPQQKRLLLAGVERVPAVVLTAASIADVCDLQALSQDETVAVQAALARVLTALCESLLGDAPTEDDIDLAKLGATLRSWAGQLGGRSGAVPDVVALRMGVRVLEEYDDEAELMAASWDDALGDLLDHTLATIVQDKAALRRQIDAQLNAGDPALAHEALQAAAIAQIPMREALLQRVTDDPTSDDAWALARYLEPDAAVLATLVPLCRIELGQREAGQQGLCSPASQAGCSSCSGKDAAADDALMVPKALEARLQPLLAGCAKVPGQHQEFLQDCLLAPSAVLRGQAAAALLQWPVEAIGADVWQAVADLRDDSHPQVRSLMADLLARRV